MAWHLGEVPIEVGLRASGVGLAVTCCYSRASYATEVCRVFGALRHAGPIPQMHPPMLSKAAKPPFRLTNNPVISTTRPRTHPNRAGQGRALAPGALQGSGLWLRQ